MAWTQNALGISLVRYGWPFGLSNCNGGPGSYSCFFEHVLPGIQVPNTELTPQAVIVDFCTTFDLDSNGDIMPEVSPSASGHFHIDINGDIMTEPI